MCITSSMLKGMNGITALIVAAVLTLLVAECEKWHSRTDLLKQKSFE